MAKITITNVRIRDLIMLLAQLSEESAAVEITVDDVERQVIVIPIQPMKNPDPNKMKLDDDNIELLS